jgi:hypothetical protein
MLMKKIIVLEKALSFKLSAFRFKIYINCMLMKKINVLKKSVKLSAFRFFMVHNEPLLSSPVATDTNVDF